MWAVTAAAGPAGQVTSGEFWKMHTLGKTSLSAYPDCGRAATGAIDGVRTDQTASGRSHTS